jgi:hypothetical protein
MPNFSQKLPKPSLRRKLRIQSKLLRLLVWEEQDRNAVACDETSGKDYVPPMESSFKTFLMDPEQPETCGMGQIGSDTEDDDSSDDSYISYQPSDEEEMDDKDDDDLASLFAWSSGNVNEGSPQAANVSTTNPPTGGAFPPEEPEYPKYDDELQLSISEEAMLDLLILCDSSGAHHSLYDELLTLLRRHSKRGSLSRKQRVRMPSSGT